MEYPHNPEFYTPPSWLSPPATWLDPPPTWTDISSSQSSSNVPLWVILASVVALLILLFFVYTFLKKRDKESSVRPVSPPADDPPQRPPTPKPDPSKTVPTPAPPPHSDCPSCGRGSGLYQLTYKCPKCIYKHEIGIHIQKPSRK